MVPARLARFFTKEGHSYQVVRELREAVVFTGQCLLADAPFSRLDLISCRNVLIYLSPEAQGKFCRSSISRYARKVCSFSVPPNRPPAFRLTSSRSARSIGSTGILQPVGRARSNSREGPVMPAACPPKHSRSKRPREGPGLSSFRSERCSRLTLRPQS